MNYKDRQEKQKVYSKAAAERFKKWNVYRPEMLKTPRKPPQL